ncbi:flavin monoamine oxidase family protein [Paraburkholderia sediminicola]|uniref:flavin monoamine oxidase family protein n=1 Tax=Paraburkholderia sediminicola TaxID=458836 RepID=UPI0038BA6380
MPDLPNRYRNTPKTRNLDVAALVPDFPFDYGNFLSTAKANNQALGAINNTFVGTQVLIVGAGAAGLVAAYEVMRMGLHPVVVEASDRIGGRFYSHRLGDADSPVIAELGGMRFPVAGKASYHYFDKVGMTANSAPFPNPGTEAAVSTVVDYKGEQDYYEYDSAEFPIPPKYTDIEDKFFAFLDADPMFFAQMVDATQEPITPAKQQFIKTTWNNLILEHGWDNLSFYNALSNEAGWNFEDIQLFGQVGFGTGGWNTDYPNSFLEVLRVMYASLDVDQRLMYDGVDSMPNRLWNTPPATFGDFMVGYWPASTTVESLTRRVFDNPFGKEVRQIVRNEDGAFSVTIADTTQDPAVTDTYSFAAVIYTPHVRILDKFRSIGTTEQYNAATRLFDAETWEAIMYTHYMQSTKIFLATKEAFWTARDPGTDKRKMSVTLSDRLPRGTYLVDYAGSAGSARGTGIFLSYTWNDDSLKFLGDRTEETASRRQLCQRVLQSIYPDVDFDTEATPTDPNVSISWEEQAFYLGGFKNNFPGQYRYQKRLFSQFMDGVSAGVGGDRFVLAGDDISWTAGWCEGAVTTALNAVNKMAVAFGGLALPGNPGPINQWDQWKPVDLP